METVMIVFMVFVSLMCVFSIVLIVMEIAQDMKKRRAEREQLPAEAIAVLPAVPEPKREEPAVVAPIPEPAAVEEVAATAEEDENAITFSAAGMSETLEEKYLALSAEHKGYYDEIVKYAMGQAGSKRVKNARYEEYKIRKTRLVRLQIKRGVVVCEFVLLNEDFKNYIEDNKLAVKQAPTVLKVQSTEAVQAAKNSIDIAVKTAADELERKKELQREKQRAARAAKKAQAEQE